MSEFEEFENALSAGNCPALRKIRKTDLHAHAYLSAGLEVYREIYPGLLLPPILFTSFAEFGSYLNNNFGLTNRNAYEKVLSAAFRRMADDGVVYAEVSFDYHDALSLGLTIAEWGVLIKALHAPYGGRFALCPEFGVSREEEPSVSLHYLEEAVQTGVFQAIDLYGNELCRPASEFQRIYQVATAAKMKKKAHVGEFGSARDVREGVNLLGLDSVQHGIAAAQDPAVMDFLRERGVVLNICPSSNLALNRCGSLAGHPIRRLFDNGVKVTLNSDDYALFGAGVSDEILALYSGGVFTAKELWQIVRTGLAEEGRERFYAGTGEDL